MNSFVTLTPKQIVTLRLMLRLQKIRALRLALASYKSGASSEDRALATIIEREDIINFSDWPLLLAESEALRTNQPQVIGLQERAHKFLKFAFEVTYSTWNLPGGTQAEQASMLELIRAETEGIKLAFQTASSEAEVVGVVQQSPSPSFKQ